MADIKDKFGLSGGGGVLLPSAASVTFPANSYIGPALSAPTNSSNTATANRLYYTPFAVQKAQAVDGIVWQNTSTAQSGYNHRLGLYSSVSAFGDTLLQASAVDTLGAAAGIREVAITEVTLQPGVLYFAAIVCESATGVVRLQTTGSNNMADYPLTNPTQLSTVTFGGMYSEAYTYAALPSSLTPDTIGNNKGPFLLLRKS
jgi:hypothetical protein